MIPSRQVFLCVSDFIAKKKREESFSLFFNPYRIILDE